MFDSPVSVDFLLNCSATTSLAVLSVELQNASASPAGSVTQTSFSVVDGSGGVEGRPTLHQLVMLKLLVLDLNSTTFSSRTSGGSLIITGIAELTAVLNDSCSTITSAQLVFEVIVLREVLPAQLFSPATLATTQTAISVSVAASAVSGAGGASDMQSMVIVTLARCSADGAWASSTGYTLVTPFALSDTARGALGGNAIACISVLFAQLLGVGVLRLVKKKSTFEALASARLPNYTLLMAATMHQSTLFCSIRLMGSDAEGGIDVAMGVFALLLCFAPPAAVVAGSLTVPRRFVAYEVPASSRFASVPWRFFAPLGTTLPSEQRRMMSSLITSFAHPSALCTASLFISSFATNIVALLPAHAPTALCSGALFASSSIHVALGVAVLVFQIYRTSSSCLVNALGLGLTAAFHAQMASGNRQGINTTLTIQAGFSIARSLVGLTNTIVEWKMSGTSEVQAANVLWMIGDGAIERRLRAASTTTVEGPLDDCFAGLDASCDNLVSFELSPVDYARGSSALDDGSSTARLRRPSFRRCDDDVIDLAPPPSLDPLGSTIMAPHDDDLRDAAPAYAMIQETEKVADPFLAFGSNAEMSDILRLFPIVAPPLDHQAFPAISPPSSVTEERAALAI